MRYKSECNIDNTREYSTLFKSYDNDIKINNEMISTRLDDMILIWLDASIDKSEDDDQHTIIQLRQIFNSIDIFTEKEICLKFITNCTNKNKLFLIVSGSLGKEILPQINHLSQIHSVYVFCLNKINHQCWAQKYKKIKGVFDDITDVCKYLERDKQKFEQNRLLVGLFESLSKKSSSPYLFNEVIDCHETTPVKYDDHQPNDDTKIAVTSADVPFSTEESCSSINEVKTNDNIQSGVSSSDTVTPIVQYKQQMELSDTGIWPSVSVIDSTRNGFFSHIHSVLGTANYSHSPENCLEYVNDHHDDPHLVVFCNPTNVELVFTFIRHSKVRKVYIYCSNDKIDEYRTLNGRFSNTVSILLHIDTLTRLILWDLSACIVDIGHHYDNVNKKNLAQARYRYAYRIHTIIKVDLNNRMEVSEHTQSKRIE